MKDQQFLTEVQAAAGLATRKEAERWAKIVGAALAEHIGSALGVHAPEARRALLAVWGCDPPRRVGGRAGGLAGAAAARRRFAAEGGLTRRRR
jgi:hypothetical protein